VVLDKDGEDHWDDRVTKEVLSIVKKAGKKDVTDNKKERKLIRLVTFCVEIVF